MNRRDNIIKWSIISIFVGLYSMVSVISTIHVIDFFRLSNPNWLAITLAIAFEVGAAASLAAIIILDKTSRWLVWSLFIIITLMQMMGNMYYAYTHLGDYQFWSELFGLNEEEPIFQKRILSVVSGAILPIVALGFIKSLVDYIRPKGIEDSKEEIHETIEEINTDKTLTESEKAKAVESRIKKALLNNSELKEKVIEEIKRIEDEDKYRKESSSEAPVEKPRIYGGM
jgi:hypothetical protein